jgi:hypothetical protein
MEKKKKKHPKLKLSFSSSKSNFFYCLKWKEKAFQMKKKM